MPIKILATADLHLGRKSSAVPGDAIESSTKFTWDRIIDWAIEHDVHILLLSGDIVEQDNKYYEAIGSIESGFNKLNRNGIVVYLVSGNHDYDVLAEIIQTDRYENVHLLGINGNWELKSYNSTEGVIQFAGWSFPDKYVRYNPMKNFYQIKPDSNAITIGLLHGEVDTPESKYGPVSISDLRDAGSDAWILGHIHKPTELNFETPYIAYPGSPHALDPGENGAHGPVLLEVDEKNGIAVETLPLSPIRYEKIEVTVDPGDDEAAIRDSITSKLMEEDQKLLPELEKVAYLVWDINLVGSHKSVSELDNWTERAVQDYEQELETGTQMIIRKVENRVQPAVENLEELAKNPSPAGKLAETILAIQKEKTTPFLEKLKEEWKIKQQKLNKTGTYSPLKANGKITEGDEQLMRETILKECNHLLNELNNQSKL